MAVGRGQLRAASVYRRAFDDFYVRAQARPVQFEQRLSKLAQIVFMRPRGQFAGAPKYVGDLYQYGRFLAHLHRSTGHK